MARRPQAASRPKGLDDELEKDANERLKHARREKDIVEWDLREAYWFAAPQRAREVSSRSQRNPHYRPEDAGQLNTSFAMEMAGDFSTVLVNTFFPQGEQWAMRKAAAIVPDAATRDAVEKQAEDGDRAIFAAIGESNFYAEVGKGFTPDIAIGVAALWIDMPSGARPMRCMSVPLRELEINVGPFGEIGDRFMVRHTRRRHVKAILPGVEMPPQVQAENDKDPEAEIVVVRGFLRDYPADGTAKWTYVALVDEVLVDKRELTGEGCCALIVGRFNPTADFAWAAGPLIQALPDLRVVDELAMKKVRAIDLTLEPPIGFPDDSFANISDGLEPGMAYPIRPGTEDAIKKMYDPPPQDPAIYFTNDLKTRIKRLFFLDFPDQPGKTPPTATQWLDEMTMAQRRIGTPGLSFWWEFCAEVFKRTEFLLEQHGVIKPMPQGKGTTRLFPYNPAEKAIEQQKVAQFARFLQIYGQAFPEEFKVVTDAVASIQAGAKMMGVDDLWKLANDAMQKAKINTLTQLKGGAVPGAPNVPDGQPAPDPSTGQTINPQISLRSQAA